MGRKKNNRDKLFQTYQELCDKWSEDKINVDNNVKYLPFNYCSLSLTPFNDAVCDEKGNIFENKYIIPYIAKFHKNPITGNNISVKELVHLNIKKGNNGNLLCPISLKELNFNMKIIAIKETGNVYSYDVYQKLNKDINNYKDLLTDIPFKKENVILLNDPNHKKLIPTFEYIKHKNEVIFITKLVNETEEHEKQKEINLPSNYEEVIENYENDNSTEKQRRLEVIDIINKNENILFVDSLNKKCKEEYENYLKIEKEIEELLYENKVSINEIKSKIDISSNCFLYHLKQNDNWKKYYHNNKSRIISNGKMALSLTSTQMELNTISSQLIPSDDELRIIYYNIVKSLQKKGFVKLSTNFGDLNLEIFCNYAPMASENFIELCSKGLYNNTKFHRLVHDFIVQGGDIKENNIFGHNFKDEFNNKVSHSQKGILSMANSGKNSNNTQFFFTLENNKANNLDNKHTIFGRVVGGIQTLDLINHIKINKFTKEVPLNDIIITNTEVYNNPFREVIRDIMWKEIKEKFGITKNNNEEKNEKFSDYFNKLIKDEKNTSSVGKYLNKKRKLIQTNDDDYQKKIQKFKESEGIYLQENNYKNKREAFENW